MDMQMGDDVKGMGAAAPTQAEMTKKMATTSPDHMMHGDGRTGAMTAGEHQVRPATSK